MKYFYIFSSVCAVLSTWLTSAGLYNEFGYDPNPDGVLRALVGMFFIGPLVAVVVGVYLKKLYKISSNDLMQVRKYSIIVLMLSIAVFIGVNYMIA